MKQGRSVKIPPAEEEGAAKTKCDELTKPPVSAPLFPLRER